MENGFAVFGDPAASGCGLPMGSGACGLSEYSGGGASIKMDILFHFFAGIPIDGMDLLPLLPLGRWLLPVGIYLLAAGAYLGMEQKTGILS